MTAPPKPVPEFYAVSAREMVLFVDGKQVIWKTEEAKNAIYTGLKLGEKNAIRKLRK